MDFFDDLEADTWSPLWFDDFVQQLGYQKDDMLKFYWLLPRKSLSDGLRIILEDKDTNAMAAIVSKIKNFVVYFDHDDCPPLELIGTMLLLIQLMNFLKCNMWVTRSVRSFRCSENRVVSKPLKVSQVVLETTIAMNLMIFLTVNMKWRMGIKTSWSC